MFAVFDWTLLADTGKALVWEHQNDYDAQEVKKHYIIILCAIWTCMTLIGFMDPGI